MQCIFIEYLIKDTATTNNAKLNIKFRKIRDLQKVSCKKHPPNFKKIRLPKHWAITIVYCARRFNVQNWSKKLRKVS